MQIPASDGDSQGTSTGQENGNLRPTGALRLQKGGDVKRKIPARTQLKKTLERNKKMKTKAVLVLLSLALVLAFAAAPVIAKSPSSAYAVTGEINYYWVGYLGETDEEGRRLIWEGTIDGDITGTMKWWFGPSPAQGSQYTGGRVGYYQARWEIWDGSELLLAGESAGKTVTPEDADGMWDGHGVVTEAGGALNALKGRKIYETGPVIREDAPGSVPPFTIFGTGLFLIY